MNVSLLAVSSVGSQNVRERKKTFEFTDYISNHVTWSAPNVRQNQKCWRSWKHTVRDYYIQSGYRNYLICRRPTIFVSGRSESWVLFSEFFCSTWSLPAIKKYKSVNPIILMIQIWLEMNYQILNNQFRCQNKGWVQILDRITVFLMLMWLFNVF